MLNAAEALKRVKKRFRNKILQTSHFILIRRASHSLFHSKVATVAYVKANKNLKCICNKTPKKL
jgi:hypothetical protein